MSGALTTGAWPSQAPAVGASDSAATNNSSSNSGSCLTAADDCIQSDAHADSCDIEVDGRLSSIGRKVDVPLNSVISRLTTPSSLLSFDASLPTLPNPFIDGLAAPLEGLLHNPPSPALCASELGLVDLDWSDREELRRYQAALDAKQVHLLDLIETKEEEFSEGIDRQYFENSTPIIAARPSWAERYVCCGRRVGTHKRVWCNAWNFCPTCASRQAHTSLPMYVPVFHRGPFFFVTSSFSGNLPFYDHHTVGTLKYWDAIKAGLRSLYDADAIRGAYWVDEMFIHSFLPPRVLPHTHGIIHADRISKDVVRQLVASIDAYRDENGDGVELEPDIKFELIPTAPDLGRCINYCTKAIDLITPYQSSWVEVELRNRARAEELNREMRDFLEGFPQVTANRIKIHRIGSLSPQYRKSFIGVKAADRRPYLPPEPGPDDAQFLRGDDE